MPFETRLPLAVSKRDSSCSAARISRIASSSPGPEAVEGEPDGPPARREIEIGGRSERTTPPAAHPTHEDEREEDRPGLRPVVVVPDSGSGGELNNLEFGSRQPNLAARGICQYLSEHDWNAIVDLLVARTTVRGSARELGRSPSTVSREVRRKSDAQSRDRAERAERGAMGPRPIDQPPDRCR